MVFKSTLPESNLKHGVPLTGLSIQHRNLSRMTLFHTSFYVVFINHAFPNCHQLAYCSFPDNIWVWNPNENDINRGKLWNTEEKTCHSVTQPTTNLTWTDLGMNTGLSLQWEADNYLPEPWYSLCYSWSSDVQLYFFFSKQ